MDSKLTVFRAEIFKMYLSVFNVDIPRDRSALKVLMALLLLPYVLKMTFMIIKNEKDLWNVIKHPHQPCKLYIDLTVDKTH